MSATMIDDIAESAYWDVYSRLKDSSRELSLSESEIRSIARMMKTALWSAIQSPHKLDRTLRTKVETLITGGDYPES